MPPKQTILPNFFRQQQPQRPLPFTSPDPPDRDGFAAVIGTPSQRRSQSPGVIVPGTPPTPFSLGARSVSPSASPRSASPVLGSRTYYDDKAAFDQLGLSTQFPPPSSGPTISPSSGTTAEYFAAHLAAQQHAAQQHAAQQHAAQLAAQQEQDPDKAAARQRAAEQAQVDNPDVFTQFQGGRRKSTRSKMSKKSRKTKSKSVKRSHRLKKKLKLKSKSARK